jgi:hypothetical protein
VGDDRSLYRLHRLSGAAPGGCFPPSSLYKIVPHHMCPSTKWRPKAAPRFGIKGTVLPSWLSLINFADNTFCLGFLRSDLLQLTRSNNLHPLGTDRLTLFQRATSRFFHWFSSDLHHFLLTAPTWGFKVKPGVVGGDVTQRQPF